MSCSHAAATRISRSPDGTGPREFGRPGRDPRSCGATGPATARNRLPANRPRGPPRVPTRDAFLARHALPADPVTADECSHGRRYGRRGAPAPPPRSDSTGMFI